VGFLGPNDVGKSTCINTILGRYEAKTGKGIVTQAVTFYGKEEFDLLLVDFPGKNDNYEYEDDKVLAISRMLDLACVLFTSTITSMMNFLELLDKMEVPFVCVLTRVDEWRGEEIDADLSKVKMETQIHCAKFRYFQGFYAINAKGDDECYDTAAFFSAVVGGER